MISINLARAKEIAHDRRRAARAVEFAPLDEVIAKRLPDMTIKAAEAERQAIRDRYADLQAKINEAGDADTLRNLVSDLPA